MLCAFVPTYLGCVESRTKLIILHINLDRSRQPRHQPLPHGSSSERTNQTYNHTTKQTNPKPQPTSTKLQPKNLSYNPIHQRTHFNNLPIKSLGPLLWSSYTTKEDQLLALSLVIFLPFCCESPCWTSWTFQGGCGDGRWSHRPGSEDVRTSFWTSVVCEWLNDAEQWKTCGKTCDSFLVIIQDLWTFWYRKLTEFLYMTFWK